ncbi:MAG: hypothetical protein AAFX08_06515 [Pseudomonadota bacterium]
MPKETEEIDERPAALLAHELRFNFFRTMMTTAITLVGGALVLKGAVLPEAPYDILFVSGVSIAAFAGICAFDGQMGVVQRLEKRKARPSLWARGITLMTPWALALGAMLLIMYFYNHFPSSGS